MTLPERRRHSIPGTDGVTSAISTGDDHFYIRHYHILYVDSAPFLGHTFPGRCAQTLAQIQRLMGNWSSYAATFPCDLGK